MPLNSVVNLALNDLEGARKAFLVSGQMGWRTPVTQLYWLEQAFDQQDYQTAAFRLDALFRSQPALRLDPSVLATFESNPDATAALVQRLRMKPNWLIHYVAGTSALDVVALERRMEVLNALARSVEAHVRVLAGL